MTESPKRPADVSRAEASRVAKRSPKQAGETARPTDSTPAVTGPFATLPTQFGRYQIARLLGSGAMGAVYLAQDTTLDRQVALKVAKVSASGSARLLKRMEAEARAGAKIDHPQICKVYDSGEIDGIRFIALQYIEGENLKNYLKRLGRRREPAEAVRFIVQIARALQAAHDKKVVHRDLKPENIILKPNGELVVMDFGLALQAARAEDAERTQKGTFLGTAAYMSPEQARGKGTADEDNRSDIYAIGCMLFEMLTGEWPFTGTMIEIMGKKCVQDAPSPLSHQPDLHPQLAAACQKMLAQKPEDRYASCNDVAAALEAIDLTSPNTVELKFDLEMPTGGLTPPRSPEIGSPPVRLNEMQNATDAFPLFTDNAPTAPSRSPAPQQKRGKKSPSLKTTVLISTKTMQSRWIKLPFPAQAATIIAGFAAMLLLGVTLWFRSGDALVKIEVLADDIEVTFFDKTIKLTDGEREYRVTPGKHRLHIKTGNAEFVTEVFTLKKGNNPAIKVEILKNELIAKAGDKEIELQPSLDAEPKEDTGIELLTNGGCEAPHDGNSIAGWSTNFGVWSVETGESRPFKGKACFRPGPALAADLSQDVSLETYAEQIKNGQLEIYFRGHVLSTSGDDQAQFIVQFLDKSKLGITDFYNTFSMSLTRKWQENSKAGIVPTTAAYVRVHLVTTLKKVDGRNVFFDNVSLKARTVGGEPLVCIPADAKSFGNHSYQFYDERLSWKEAKAKCELLGGNLVIIDSAEENKFVANLVAMAAWQDAWIGITDEAQEGKWLTVSGQPLPYTNWFQKQPNNAAGQEHFALMSNHEIEGQRIAWQWCDQPNRTFVLHQPGFVCEWNTIRAAAKGLGSGVSQTPQSSPTSPLTDGDSAGQRKVIRIDNIDYAFRWCPPGSFKMGSPQGEIDRGGDEDQVDVTLTPGFWILETEVTQAMWMAVMMTQRWQGLLNAKEGGSYPASYVSWDDATSFCVKLSQSARSTGVLSAGASLSLPTEAQWEYACRAGTTTTYSFANNAGQLSNYAWHEGNTKTERYAHAVGTKTSNPWGLSDMHGNVWEWCDDWYAGKLPGGTNPRGPASGQSRVLRGGSWYLYPGGSRSADRYWFPQVGTSSNLGFRLALVREEKAPGSAASPQAVVGLGHGIWRIENGELWCAEPSGDSEDWLFVGNREWADYDFTVRATCEMPLKGHGPGIFFRSTSSDHATFAAMNVFKSPQDYMDEIDGTSKRSSWNDSSIPRYVGPAVRDWSGNGHEIKASVRGKTVQISVDGVPTIKYEGLRHANGYVGVRSHKDWPSRYRNPKVVSPDGKVVLDGWPALPPEITSR